MTSKHTKNRDSIKAASKRHIAYDRIRAIIENARANIVHAVNIEMVLAYWHIGKEIVEEEQRGKKRADYGKVVLKRLSEKLTTDFGKGFDESNLRNIRMFYLTYPKRDALRPELSWTHYRILMRVGKSEARTFYEAECIANNWSARELERQKGSLLYERPALSKDKKAVMRLARKGQEVYECWSWRSVNKEISILADSGFIKIKPVLEKGIKKIEVVINE